MHARFLGRSDLEVSDIGFGCMSLTRLDQAREVLTAALDAGVTLFDTAEVYGAHANEKLVGEVLQPVRDQVKIATKFGFNVNNGLRRASTPARTTSVRSSTALSPGCASRQIDLLYQHRLDPDVPIEETAGAVAELIQAGKVGRFGLSEVGVDTIRRAHAVQPVTAVQSGILTVVAGGRSADPAGPGGAGHRTGPVQPSGQGLLHRHDQHGGRRRGQDDGDLPALQRRHAEPAP